MKKWRGKVWMKERFLDSVRFLCLSALKYMANITVPSVRFNFFGRSANKKNAELHLLGVWSFTLQKFRRKSEEGHIRIIRDVIKVIQCDIKLLKLTAGCIFKYGFSACPVKQIKVRLEAKSGVCRLSIHLADRMIFH